MTGSEFREWLVYQTGMFTAHAAWLSRFPATARSEGDPTQQSILDGWAHALADVSLADAKAASLAMFRGDADAPKMPDETPRCVIAFARRAEANRRAVQRDAEHSQRGRRFDGEPAYSCPQCNDEGCVEVYDEKTVRAMQEGNVKHFSLNPSGGVPIYVAMAFCPCDAGRRWGARTDRNLFDPDRHFRVGRWTLSPTARYIELESMIQQELSPADLGSEGAFDG